MLRLSVISCAAGILFLSACTTVDSTFGPVFGQSGPSAAPVGLVVGDEPFAVKAGALVLSQGGSAVDAATATYFALSVTYPVAAGLGGGGVCIVHEPNSGRNETFAFLARDSASKGAFAVPGNVAGFARMQALYGALPWQRDVSPAEGYAATGFPISRALAARLSETQNIIRLDAGLSREFLDESGKLKPIGTVVSNPDLALTLAAIREQRGPIGLYRGAVAEKLVDYASQQGSPITASELASYEPSQADARAIPVGQGTAYIPPENIGAGKFAATLLSHVVRARGAVDSSNPMSAVAIATKQTLDSFGIASLPKDLGATGFAVTDTSGEAVSCAVTMNGPFGSGHTVPGTGVTFAASPSRDQAGLSAAFLTPVIATDTTGSVVLAAAGAGGPNGTAAAIYALQRVAQGQDLTQPGSIHSTGLAPYDTINIITCHEGVCAVLPDSGANGLGAPGNSSPY